jgi:metal-responsive CopG/Arc/MetJ family transcriptional regulator
MDQLAGDGAAVRCPKVKLTVSIDSGLARRADRRWRLTGRGSRSALFEEALEHYLAAMPEEIPPHLQTATG